MRRFKKPQQSPSSEMKTVKKLKNHARISSFVNNEFKFTAQEIQAADLSRYRDRWNSERLRKLTCKAGLIGGLSFNISDLLSKKVVELDSQAFINFCRVLREDGSCAALATLKTPDYALVLCASAGNATFVRNANGVSVIPSVKALRLEIAGDLERGEHFAISAGLIDQWAAAQFGGIRRYIRGYFWASA